MYLHISVAKHELHVQKRGKGVERGRDSCCYEKKKGTQMKMMVSHTAATASPRYTETHLSRFPFDLS